MQYYKIEFRKDNSGHRENKLKKYGTVFQYLLGSDGFNPKEKRDVEELVRELKTFPEFSQSDERDLTYQLERTNMGDISIQLRA